MHTFTDLAARGSRFDAGHDIEVAAISITAKSQSIWSTLTFALRSWLELRNRRTLTCRDSQVEFLRRDYFDTRVSPTRDDNDREDDRCHDRTPTTTLERRV